MGIWCCRSQLLDRDIERYDALIQCYRQTRGIFAGNSKKRHERLLRGEGRVGHLS